MNTLTCFEMSSFVFFCNHNAFIELEFDVRTLDLILFVSRRKCSVHLFIFTQSISVVIVHLKLYEYNAFQTILRFIHTSRDFWGCKS